ncbi:hypothetical protein SAMN02910317_00801 [Ruminococcaceae bacterium FB2012]|nr:hypothetical protein SAMN02910317_00801 [Ruminococcaceae bacterium FB2012]
MEKKIYRLNNQISFRKCFLCEEKQKVYGDCTNFIINSEEWVRYYECCQDGIHYHCTEHPEIELEKLESDEYYGEITLTCPRCKNEIPIGSYAELRKMCLRALNRELFKDAKLIRLDDWYTPEIKEKLKGLPSDYWITTDVKTDKDGDTIIVLYIGNKNEKSKAQFFIKPEKCQLSNDHKDTDPSKLISKIEVTLKRSKLTHSYDD